MMTAMNRQNDIYVPSDDSFWAEVPSINENLSASTTNAVLAALHGEHSSASDSDFDLNIF